ncbi:type II toxin-antitoxin system Phd/YefM family antitoxin [Pseudorhodoplanes sp.]|uniref:type II toxin-antitoxin system Phd/YefM family antitoxin n=1 Tax=Pseudorhodoplanes sp. TaxID=1934341 RepID=UPI00391D31CD
MIRRTWSLQDAKNRFSEVVEAARRKPQTVTKHGKPAVVVLDAEEYDRLQKLQQLEAPSFAEMLLAIPQGNIALERLGAKPRDVEI